MNEYEQLYDQIQELSNKIDMYCWTMQMDESQKQEIINATEYPFKEILPVNLNLA